MSRESDLNRATMEQIIEAANQTHIAQLLRPFDLEDPDPLATLAEARRMSFLVVAQSIIEPQLTYGDYALRAYLLMRDRGVRRPWSHIIASGENPEEERKFVIDAERSHVMLDIQGVDASAIAQAAKPVRAIVEDLTNETIIKMLAEGEPFREHPDLGRGMIPHDAGPRPSDQTTSTVESLLSVPGNPELMQSLFRQANATVLDTAAHRRTNFTIALATASRRDYPSDEDRSAAIRRLQGNYGLAVRPILENVANTFPGLTDRQRQLFPALAGVVRVDPPPRGG